MDYEENWEVIRPLTSMSLSSSTPSVINRVKAAFININTNNQFVPYDYYKVNDTIDENKFHYVVGIYGGRNGSGNWLSYFTDMKTIFSNLINKTECHFSDVWLIEWKNSCADDTFAALVGLRD